MGLTENTGRRGTAATATGHAGRSATHSRLRSSLLTALLVVGWLYLAAQALGATPVGPTITYISNETSTTVGNGTGTTLPGGYIAIANLNANQVADNWKGFAGNITGGLALLDAQGYQLYSWSVGTITGQVYGVRSNPVSWSNLTCANGTNVISEEAELGFTPATALYDNFTVTYFENYNHSAFTAAGIAFATDQCNYSTRLYVNNSAQGASTADFEQILLNDGSSRVYTTIIENNKWGYAGGPNNGTFDYELLVAHNVTVSVATTYYLFVELV